jgi:hypothetical protein
MVEMGSNTIDLKSVEEVEQCGGIWAARVAHKNGGSGGNEESFF